MTTPCDICLDETCGGQGHTCSCHTCNHRKDCYKFLHPTIRITTKCTQSCDHCCFSCTPNSKQMMTIQTAKEITQFLKANDIKSLNVMGGEFFCNPKWYPILAGFLSIGCHIRLVSNGDWAKSLVIQQQLLMLNNLYKGQLHISISNDKWHTNAQVKEAEDFLSAHNFAYDVESEVDENQIVPIGRSELSYGIYGHIACYCNNPVHQYSFLIDENGTIYKCSFGVLDYASVQEYQNGGFAARFKEFNKKFYSIFMPSCTSCIRYATRHNAIAKT